MQNGGENGAAERMCRRKLAGLSEPKWRFCWRLSRAPGGSEPDLPESGPGAEGGGVWAQHAAAGKKKEQLVWRF